MANTDFGILLKTLLDKSGINSELEQVQKIVNKYSIDIMPELKTASLRNQMKAVSQEIANDFNKAFGTNLTGNDVFKAFENQAKQAEKAVKEEAKAIEAARKEQESLTNAMAKGREQAELSRQAEQKRQQMAQNNAINKALEQEYQERQKNIEAARKQAELDKQNALAFTKSASERLSSAISKYSYGDTSDANAMMKQMNRGLSNFGDLSNVQGNITQLSATVDKIIADLKLSHEQSLQALNEEIKAEQTLQSQKDAFNKKNINAIDYEIQKREEEAKAFSSMLQAQMQEQQKADNDSARIAKETAKTEKEQNSLNKAIQNTLVNLRTLEDRWEKQGVLVGEFKTKVEQLKTSITSVGSKDELDNLKLDIKDLRIEASQLLEANKAYEKSEKELATTIEKRRAAQANSAKEKAKSNTQQELAQQREVNAILSKQESAYKEIWNINKQIANLDTTEDADVIGALNEKKKFYQDIYLSAQKELQAYNNIVVSHEHLASLAEIRKKAESEIGVTVAKQNKALAEEADRIQLSFDNGHGDSEYKNRIQSLVNDFEKYGLSVDEANKKTSNLRTILDGFKVDGNFLPDDQLVAQADKFETEFKAVKVSLDSAKLSFDKFLQPVSSEKASSLIIRINDFLSKNKNIATEAKKELLGFIRLLQSGNVNLSDWNKFDTRLKEINIEMREAGRLGKTLKQTLVDGAKSFAQWTLSSGAVMEVWNTFKEGIRTVKELDDSLLELKKVSDLSVEGLEKVVEQAYALGDTVGKTGREVIDATTEFKRAGYGMQESMDMAEAAMVMTNVAEGITETSDAAGTLISVLKGFNMAESEVMSIVDMINSTSNQSPIGFDQLAEGLERTSGTLAQSGVSIQETIGLLTAGYAQLRNIEKVSQGLITISARIRGVGEDGEAIDGLSSKMSEDFGKIGIAVENADGSMRSLYEIAQDYSKVLPNLTDKQKQYYAELAAGKHQVTVWNSIVQQFQDAEKATAQAIDSVGSASEENQKKLDSISGKIAIFDSAVEHLSTTLIESDLIKFFVDLGTIGVKAVDGLISSLNFLGGSLGTLATIGSGVLGAMGHGLTNYVTNIIVYKSPFRKQYNNAILLT